MYMKMDTLEYNLNIWHHIFQMVESNFFRNNAGEILRFQQKSEALTSTLHPKKWFPDPWPEGLANFRSSNKFLQVLSVQWLRLPEEKFPLRIIRFHYWLPLELIHNIYQHAHAIISFREIDFNEVKITCNNKDVHTFLLQDLATYRSASTKHSDESWIKPRQQSYFQTRLLRDICQDWAKRRTWERNRIVTTRYLILLISTINGQQQGRSNYFRAICTFAAETNSREIEKF